MRVVVAGATGAIGVPLVRDLVDHGHEVIGVTRSAQSAADNGHIWAGAIVANVLDAESLRSAARPIRADAVIHQLTALARPPIRYRDLDQTNDLRIRGTRHLLELAAVVGATRFVTQSFFGGYGYGDHGEAILTEEDHFAPSGRSAGLERALAAMRSGEQQVLSSTNVEGVALRYGLFYGPGRPLDPVLKMLGRRRFPIPRGGGGTLSYLYVPDAARATVAALERGRAGQAYNVCDDEPVPWGTFISAMAMTFGTPPPIRVPSWMLRAAPYAHAFMTSTIRLSNQRAKEELDWSPSAPTYREGLRLAREEILAQSRDVRA
jgi:nucleoside-diphosphate-sugar epimerase